MELQNQGIVTYGLFSSTISVAQRRPHWYQKYTVRSSIISVFRKESYHFDQTEIISQEWVTRREPSYSSFRCFPISKHSTKNARGITETTCLWSTREIMAFVVDCIRRSNKSADRFVSLEKLIKISEIYTWEECLVILERVDQRLTLINPLDF